MNYADALKKQVTVMTQEMTTKAQEGDITRGGIECLLANMQKESREQQFERSAMTRPTFQPTFSKAAPNPVGQIGKHPIGTHE